MATYTENYNLILPETEDVYDAEDYNENFSELDTTLASIEDKVNSLSSTPTSVIKSVQRVLYSLASSSTGQSISINEIDPTKSFIIMEKLKDSSGNTPFEYTLDATTLTISHSSYSGSEARSVSWGFWIIEFN